MRKRINHKTVSVDLTGRQIEALTRLLPNAIMDTGSNEFARSYREVLNKLTAASLFVLDRPVGDGMKADYVANLTAALVIARDYIAETHEELMRSVCLADGEGSPIRETADPEELKTIEYIEGHLKSVDDAIAAGGVTLNPAMEACRLLVQAYRAAAEYGDHVDWSDIDVAHAEAVKAVKEAGDA